MISFKRMMARMSVSALKLPLSQIDTYEEFLWRGRPQQDVQCYREKYELLDRDEFKISLRIVEDICKIVITEASISVTLDATESPMRDVWLHLLDFVRCHLEVVDCNLFDGLSWEQLSEDSLSPLFIFGTGRSVPAIQAIELTHI